MITATTYCEWCDKYIMRHEPHEHDTTTSSGDTVAVKELEDIHTLTPEEALRQLGDTADEVAAELLRRGCKGILRNARACPLAVYLQDLGFDGAQLDGRHIWDMSAAPGRKISLAPLASAEFMGRFDVGQYPDLVR